MTAAQTRTGELCSDSGTASGGRPRGAELHLMERGGGAEEGTGRGEVGRVGAKQEDDRGAQGTEMNRLRNDSSGDSLPVFAGLEPSQAYASE